MLYLGSGTLDLAVVEKTYVQGGRIYCDCGRPGVGARRWRGVPVAGMGGGEGRGLTVPPTPSATAQGALNTVTGEGAQVIIGYMDSGRPVIIGTLGHAKLGLSKDAQTESSNTTDADGAVDSDTVALQNAGAGLFIDGHGHIRLVPAIGKPMRVELGSGAVFRVSKGNNADAAVALGPVTRSEFDRVINRLNEVSASLAVLAPLVATITAIGPLVVSGGVVPVNPASAYTFLHVPEASATADIESQTMFIPLEGSGGPEGQSQ